MSDEESAQALFRSAQQAHAAGDIARGLALSRDALAIHGGLIEAIEHVATVLITRSRHYSEGLQLIDSALALRTEDAGLWYSRGWLYEFAAHEIRRRRPAGAEGDLDVRSLYETAALCFRACLDLKPEGKLVGDAEDLLDHVENELQAF